MDSLLPTPPPIHGTIDTTWKDNVLAAGGVWNVDGRSSWVRGRKMRLPSPH
jgi:hypothetical protein